MTFPTLIPVGRQIRKLTAVLVLVVFAGLGSAQAQSPQPQAPQPDTAGMQAVHDYTLTTDFLHKVEAITREGRAMNVQSSVDPRSVRTLDEMAQKLDAVPKIHGLVTKHGLSTREYLIGTMALAGAAMASSMKDDPSMKKYVDEGRINTANVAFYEQHKQEVDSLLQSSGGQAQ